jgi:hypothetical protein
MSRQATSTDAAESLRYVFRELVRCPVQTCQSTRYHVYGHGETKDETKVQYAKCLNEQCNHKFKIIWE